MEYSINYHVEKNAKLLEPPKTLTKRIKRKEFSDKFNRKLKLERVIITIFGKVVKE